MATIGYYDMTAGQGNATQVDEITANGHSAVNITVPNASQLAGIDTLYVQNPDNGGFGAEYTQNMSAIAAAVQSGMNLVIFDRAVSGAPSILPGGGSITAIRDFASGADVNVAAGAPASFTDGSAGTIDNSTFDGGGYSNHGYVTAASLPPGAVPLLTTSNPAHIVAFTYPYGAGTVFYSTMPLDYYTSGGNGAITQAEITTLFGNTVDILCFAHGTRIRTLVGEVFVHDLQPGDRVLCLDGQARPVRWIGRSHVTRQDLSRRPGLLPMRIAKGALGSGMPSRDLLVSRQHRILIEPEQGCPGVLVAACKLAGLPGIGPDPVTNAVTYFHLLLDDHQIIWADGAPAETLFLGQQTLKTLTRSQRAEIAVQFPVLPATRPLLPPQSAKEQRKAVAAFARQDRSALARHASIGPRPRQQRLAAAAGSAL